MSGFTGQAHQRTRGKLKFIGCEIIYREACYLAATGPNVVDLEFLRKGLHDLERPDMLAKIQAAVDAVEPEAGYEAVLLGYARCSDGVVGVAARDIPLVIPRAHDCITLFFGSRGSYAAWRQSHPGTCYATSGWVERNIGEGELTQPAYGLSGVMANLGLTETYEQLVAKHGAENADYIVESLGGWKKNYTHYLYLKMGICDETAFIVETRRCAAENGWEFELRDGDWTLLEKLFHGQWDDDFVVVPPGRRIAARNDERILDVE